MRRSWRARDADAEDEGLFYNISNGDVDDGNSICII